jgi:hypothetical protein
MAVFSLRFEALSKAFAGFSLGFESLSKALAAFSLSSASLSQLFAAFSQPFAKPYISISAADKPGLHAFGAVLP